METAVNCKLLLYADDSVLLVSGKNPAEIESKLSSELSSVSDWLIDNRLSLHLGKTETILFGSKSKIKSNQSLNVVCNGTKINSCSTVKYLGAVLDQTLDCEAIASSVLSKVYGRQKFLYRKSNFLNCSTKKLVSSALVQCHYDYACSFWYSSLTKKTKSKLQVSQNRLIRYVLGLPVRTHLYTEHFKRLGWLPIDLRVDQLKLNIMYRSLNGQSPSYICDKFTLTSNVHNHRTRSSHHSLVIPHYGSKGEHSFSVSGAKLWNNLSADIINSNSISVFKTKVKNHLYEHMFSLEINETVYY